MWKQTTGWRFDAVVISDLHLGARNCRHHELLRFLERVETDHLIVNGDLFDDDRLRKLRQADVRVVEALREYSLGVRTEWLIGNHDPPAEWFAGLLGIRAENETTLHVGGKRYLVHHGHRWDASLHLPALVIDTADAIYGACQWLDPSHRVARYLKRASKHFVRAIQRLERKAVEEAHTRHFDGVILGHSHVVCDRRRNEVHYLNSGCWTEKPASFIGVRNGRARAYSWDKLVGREQRRAAPVASPASHSIAAESFLQPALMRALPRTAT